MHNDDMWQEYRKRVRWFFGAWIGGFIIVGILGLVITRVSSISPDLIGGLLFVVWATAWLRSGYRLNNFPCPRSGEPYFVKKGIINHTNQLRKTCGHCGLKKYEIF